MKKNNDVDAAYYGGLSHGYVARMFRKIAFEESVFLETPGNVSKGQKAGSSLKKEDGPCASATGVHKFEKGKTVNFKAGDPFTGRGIIKGVEKHGNDQFMVIETLQGEILRSRIIDGVCLNLEINYD